MKTNKIIILFFTVFCIYVIPLKADIIYFPSEYNALYNEKVALELELKTLKRQFSNEKAAFETRRKELESKIENLEDSLEAEKKNRAGEKSAYERRIAELEKVRDILKRTGSEKEKQLIDENKALQKKCKEESDRLRKELQDERESYIREIAELKKKYDSKISELESLISNLNSELAEIKKLSESQQKELDRMSAQANELEQQLSEEIERGEIRLKRLHEKIIINIDDRISFDSGSSSLKKDVMNALEKVANILSNYPENRIVIEGHTDNVPISTKKFRDNWQLSSERALAVLNFLLKNTKLDPVRFSAAGFGEYQPIVSNDTPENKALNRRVDIVVIPRLSRK
ncbi:MAG: OmpA family protein [Spirochaetes bacterium]|nr:OmpA family protein [Spirochaetota bacterium]